MRNSLLIIMMAGGLGLSFPDLVGSGTVLDSLEREISGIVAEAVPAVVSIWTEPMGSRWEKFFEEREPPAWFQQFLKSKFATRRKRSNGTGFIIAPEGYIITTNQVVRDASEVEAALFDGRVLPARVVGRDPKSNLALLKVEGKNFPHLKLGRSGALKVGSWGIVVGNPYGLCHSPSFGIISGLGRSGLGTADYEDLIQVTAPINPGDSGGPLLNSKGEVIGVITASLSGYREFEFDMAFIRRFHDLFPGDALNDLDDFFRHSMVQGIGFAIPIDLARKVAERLKNSPRLDRGWLGVKIEEVLRPLPQQKGTAAGVVIVDVYPRSPAARAGLKKQDVILSIDGNAVTSARELKKAILFTPVGKTVQLQVLRAEETVFLPLTIESPVLETDGNGE